MMLRYVLSLLLVCTIASSYSQNKTKVLLLGTYHMAGTVDPVKVNDSKADILQSTKQAELEDVLRKLENFGPSSIFVENIPSKQSYWDTVYRRHIAGEQLKLKNEIYQIGIKLASKLQLPQGVTCIDWQNTIQEFKGEKLFAMYLDQMNNWVDATGFSDEEIFSEYDKDISSENNTFLAEIPELDLITVFRRINAEERLKKSYFLNLTTFLDKNPDR